MEKSLQSGLDAGRKRFSRIVGRDTASLTEEEIIKATVETVAENASDGVISPMIYSLIGGPVLMMGFKAASTLDSMVGYLDPKYKGIGWSSTKLDDVLNFIPARLTALLLCAGAFLTDLDAVNTLRIVKRDHNNRKSPNCAWPESAAAGALGIQLGGTHLYFRKPIVKQTIGDPHREPAKEDIGRANKMMYAACMLFMALVVFLGYLSYR